MLTLRQSLAPITGPLSAMRKCDDHTFRSGDCVHDRKGKSIQQISSNLVPGSGFHAGVALMMPLDLGETVNCLGLQPFSQPFGKLLVSPGGCVQFGFGSGVKPNPHGLPSVLSASRARSTASRHSLNASSEPPSSSRRHSIASSSAWGSVDSVVTRSRLQRIRHASSARSDSER